MNGLLAIAWVLAVTCQAAADVPPSKGEYRGQTWRIDSDHRLWWNGRPYIRFAFTGNGAPADMIKAGFDQFSIMPEERWPISGPDPVLVERVDRLSDELEAVGATYYGGLNAFWPWRYGDLIAEEDKAPVFVRDVHDVTALAGRRTTLDLTARFPIHPEEREGLTPVRTQVVLFDLQHSTTRDLTDRLDGIVSAAAEQEPSHERGGEWDGGKIFRIHLKQVHLPDSDSLRLVVGMEVRLKGLPGVGGLVPLWKPGIRSFYEQSLRAFRDAYSKPGLRGLQFGDEINTWPMSLLGSRIYLDLRHDPLALRAYHDWLERRFDKIVDLNGRFGTEYKSFDDVDWQVPLHPHDPRLARTDAAAEREERWAGAKAAWGLAGSPDQLRAVSETQDEFRIWFYGRCLADYAERAKRIIGDVPVFVCSAAIPGDPDQYLAMHRWALREGVDGLSRNHYGHARGEEPHTLAAVARWMDRVQRESGRAKHLFANEIGYVRPHVTDDEWAAAEGAALGPDESFGRQWAFPSKEALRDMLLLLSDHGYKGFNRFLIDPSAPGSVREVDWMAQLRPEIVQRVAPETEN